jgi:hypothetical protein
MKRDTYPGEEDAQRLISNLVTLEYRTDRPIRKIDDYPEIGSGGGI